MKNRENYPICVMLTAEGVETERTVTGSVKMRVDSVRVPKLVKTRGKGRIDEADIASAFDGGKERFFIFKSPKDASCLVVYENDKNETRFFEGPRKFPKLNEANVMGITENGRNVAPCFVYEKTGLVLCMTGESVFSIPVPGEIARHDNLRALSFSPPLGSETIMLFYSDSVVLPVVLNPGKNGIERVMGEFDSVFLNERYMFLFKRDAHGGGTRVSVVSFGSVTKEKTFFVDFGRETKGQFRAAYDAEKEFLVLYAAEGYGVLSHVPSGKEKRVRRILP